MNTATKNQRTITEFQQEYYLAIWAEAFITDRKVQNLSPGTIQFYQQKIRKFLEYCDTQLITQIDQITPNIIRQYMLWLEERGNNPGGIHAHYRTLRTFLYWWEDEIEPGGWKNPIRKVKAPKVAQELLEPADIGVISKMLDTCPKHDFYGDRDRAIILALMDTGARASEFVNMNLDDLNYTSGEILIKQGKGGKPRSVFLGKAARKALRTYLRRRKDSGAALWVSQSGERLNYFGLRSMMRRRAKQAGVQEPSLHSFRRFFALEMLRNGVDIFSLQKLMGHADLQVLRRYLAQTTNDTLEAHRRGSPVDNLDI